jgi:hypothetical protein
VLGPLALAVLAAAGGVGLALAVSGAGAGPSAWSGPLVMAAAVLVVAGGAKALRPRAAAAALGRLGLPVGAAGVRLLAGAEVATGAAGVVIGGSLAAGAVAGWYVGFTVVAAALARAPEEQGCGCFGSAGARPGALQVGLNAASAVVALAAAAAGAGGLVALVGATPGAGVPVLAVCAVGTALVVAAYTVGPEAAGAARPGRRQRGGPVPAFSLGPTRGPAGRDPASRTDSVQRLR